MLPWAEARLPMPSPSQTPGLFPTEENEGHRMMPLVIIPEVDDSWSGNDDRVGQQQECEVTDRERSRVHGYFFFLGEVNAPFHF